jgi:ligand-binding SRPBCC domain-containing protein
MPETLTATQWTPHPVELVFAFCANPANLPHLMPKSQRARIESSRLIPPPPRPVSPDPTLRFQSPAAGVDSEIALSFRPIPLLPFRLGWISLITEFVWNSHFVDIQVKGPFASWSHRHGITSETREGICGALIADHVEYTLPLGPMGTLAHTIYVRDQLEATFAHRQKRLEEILPIAARQATRRS